MASTPHTANGASQCQHAGSISFHHMETLCCVVFCVCVIVLVVVMLIPGAANILKHLKAFELTLTRHACFTNICFLTPVVNLTALCKLCVFVGIVVRYIVDKRACVRQDDVQVAAALKVFIHIQGGFNVLLELTPITQFYQLFRAERNEYTLNAN